MGEALNLPIYRTQLMEAETYSRFWPVISAELDKVPHIWQDYYTKQYLRDVFEHKELMVWMVATGDTVRLVIYGRFLTTPQGLGLQFVLAFGRDLKVCLPSMVATFEKIANDMKCDFCEVIGRPGWEKMLPGFKRRAVVLVRSLHYSRIN